MSNDLYINYIVLPFICHLSWIQVFASAQQAIPEYMTDVLG